MVSIRWCLKCKNGLELVEPNGNMSFSYLKMAEESLRMIGNVEGSRIWTGSTCYYTIYYSLYSLMMRIGVKCEIHSCSIEFMKKFLDCFYSLEYFGMIDNAFRIRNDVQYYPGNLIKEKELQDLRVSARDFFVKTENIIKRIGEEDVEKIRKLVRVANGK